MMEFGQHLLIILLGCFICVTSNCVNPIAAKDGTALCARTDFVGNENAGRRLQMTAPRGETSSMNISVMPSWDMWSAMLFPSGFAEGIFGMQQMWPTSVDTYLSASDVTAIVRVTNFNGPSSGIITQPIVQMSQGDDATFYNVARQFVGRFKQSYDSACFPFDQQEVTIDVEIQKPTSRYFQLQLLCGEGATPKDKSGNVLVQNMHNPINEVNIHSCTLDLGSTSVGFTWDSIVCTKTGKVTISCKMNGTRQNTRIITNFLMPSIVVCMMSFLSFGLHISAAMPRIATTMIAMLTQINLKMGLSKTLPASGDMSWIETYFSIATAFMFFNLFCHVAGMWSHKHGSVQVVNFIDTTGSGISLSLFFFMPSLVLLTLNCHGTQAAAIMVVASSGLLLIMFVGKAIFTRKAAIMEMFAEEEDDENQAQVMETKDTE